MREIEILKNNLEGLKGCHVAGGALTSLFTRNPINDFDIYPKSRKDLVRAIEWAYDNKWNPVNKSNRAITFTENGVSSFEEPSVLQIMTFDSYPTHKDIFKYFDFTICMGALDLDTKKLHLHKDFLKHNSQRVLVFNDKTKYPYASARRVDKYKERGYTIGRFEQMKILMACASKKIKSWHDFKEQMGGIYGKILEIPEGKKFNKKNLNKAMSLIRKKDSEKDFGQLLDENGDFATKDSLVWEFSNKKLKMFSHNGTDYYYWAKKWKKESALPEFIDLEDLKAKGNIKITSLKKAYGLSFYKVVLSDGDNFMSCHKNSFKYINQETVSSESPYIYVEQKDTINRAINYNQVMNKPENFKIIKLKAKPEDILIDDKSHPFCHIKLKKAKVLGEAEYSVVKPDENGRKIVLSGKVKGNGESKVQDTKQPKEPKLPALF
jgi:hypothetical protein